MKTFIFSDTLLKVNRTYGGSTHLCRVYRVVNNVPSYIGEVNYNTSSTIGAIGEVNNWLTDNNFIPCSWNERSGKNQGKYYCYRTDAASKKYQIVEV